MALAVAVGLLMLRRPSLEFHVGQEGSARSGEWIVAQNEPVPITFSDGTQLTLFESARARIVDIGADGASVIVDRGLLRASILRRPGTRWRVSVGPYQVRVTGTQFDVAWQPESERFSLVLREGSVSVTGPGLGQALEVSAGQELDLSPRSGQQSLLQAASTAGTPLPDTAPSAPAVPSVPAVPVATEPEPRRQARASGAPAGSERNRHGTRAGSPRAPGFRELAAAGQYREALAAAERAGFERLCRTTSANDLLLLADVARLAADFVRAQLAYHSVRERFGGAPAAHAAFFLGRLAFDHDANYAEAARLFALSLAEQPDGPLAREAAGRLMEARVRLADTPGARQAARQYLEQYPDGPHAKSAERLLRAR